MSKRILKLSEPMIFSGLFSLELNQDDFEKYKAARGLFIEDNWERVKMIFRRDGYGNLHPEMKSVITSAQVGFFSGGIIGGMFQSLKSSVEFMENNDANIFLNRKDALSKLVTQNTLGFFQGGYKWGLRFAFLFGGFSLMTSCIELYRNKIGIIEYTLGGIGMGSLLKFTYGIKGMISGGVVGGVLGTIYGTLNWFILRLLNVDSLELKYVSFVWTIYKDRTNYFVPISLNDRLFGTNLKGQKPNQEFNYEFIYLIGTTFRLIGQQIYEHRPYYVIHYVIQGIMISKSEFTLAITPSKKIGTTHPVR